MADGTGRLSSRAPSGIASAGLRSTRISLATHLERVETAPLDLGGHAVSNRVFDREKKSPRQSEYHHDVHHDAHQLRSKLANVAVKQPAHWTRHAVPSVAIGAVRKQPEGERTPDP